MRQRRDPFARITYVTSIAATFRSRVSCVCSWCGTQPTYGRPLYAIRAIPDAGHTYDLKGGAFCSWSCAESYQEQPIAR